MSGRSVLVGRPQAALLLGRNATVTMCSSRTRDLDEIVPPRRRARGRGRGSADGPGRLGTTPARRGHRRGHEPHRGRPGRRRGLRRGRRASRADHARARRGRPDRPPACCATRCSPPGADSLLDMDLRRVRWADWLTGLTGLALFGFMFIPWYGLEGDLLVVVGRGTCSRARSTRGRRSRSTTSSSPPSPCWP